MIVLLVFALATLPLLALSGIMHHRQPEAETPSLTRRNPCDGLDYPQISLYEEYSAPLCPAPKHLDGQGACEDSGDPQHDCASFCQLTTTYVWARESPFFRSECHYPMRCELRKTDSTKWSLEGYISENAPFQKAIDVGITGGIGSSWGRTSGHSWSITPQPGECGYFTWVPVIKRTCGTVTSSLKIGTSKEAWRCLNKTKTTQNVCHDQVWSLEGGPDGIVMWVHTDCSIGVPLGSEYQDPVYSSPGVSLYETFGIAMFDSWSNNTCVMTMTKAVTEGTWFDLDVKARGLQLGGVGNNGEILFRRINACGDITSWNFTWADVAYPNSMWDMEASSTIFVRKGVQKACVGTAMQQAGGVMDKCK